MANIYETTISCRFCNGVKRITHLNKDVDPDSYEGWISFKDGKGKVRYMCDNCVEAINLAVDSKNKKSGKK